MKILASILAAGKCNRFGYPKFLSLYGNRPVIKILLEETATVFEEVIVISGYYHDLIKEFVNVPVVFNSDYHEGMASSIRIATFFAENNNFDGICIIPCDMPFVNRKMLKLLKDTFLSGSFDGVSFYKDDNPVVPALFSNNMFQELKKLKGDKGAKKLLLEIKNKYYIKGYEPYLIDIDTVEEYIKTVFT